ncbi:MAG: hypothetical protein RBR71_09930 [Gudongella sp.]|nr:hypothetical protein [Gudongella sp.]
MSITIRRNTGWIGSASLIQIIVNGEKVAGIMENQNLEVELPDDENSLKVMQFGVRSNKIEVRDRDILEIKYKRWHLMLFPLMVTITFIMSVILYLPYKSTILPVHILFLIIIFVTKGFIIKKF